MRLILIAIFWALMVIGLAVGSRFGLVDRRIVELLVLVCPFLPFLGRSGAHRCREASAS